MLFIFAAACQTGISGGRLDCLKCVINGPSKCDVDGCPESTSLNNSTMLCELCQTSINDESDLHCTFCGVNGPGRCDSLGCPKEYTKYDPYSLLCIKVKPPKCKYT